MIKPVTTLYNWLVNNNKITSFIQKYVIAYIANDKIPYLNNRTPPIIAKINVPIILR